MRSSRPFSFALLTLVAASAAGAQGMPSSLARSPDPSCDYRTCALGIVPAWNGLAVVRGASGPRVANLHFFWPRDVSAALRGAEPGAPGADSAAAQARGALRLRRIGAALTDAGIVMAGVAAIGALGAGEIRRVDGVLLGVGAASLGVSVPFQFAADGALSRAVWWHNLRFAR